ncbi:MULTISPECIES: co-chaperone YbbN [unclassified Pseudomonas]|uniref:thioredoxin family protein n=1 Tax=unclassified Pseudomonas TaxID=196821 RepID=UPI000CD30325|nr:MULTISPECIES: thioredoxin family protein [unclassified Pseudomonas]POA33956.1 thioredoxin [Pseudomonas sp. GW456-R21]POA65232.1 thioredoxin [Pseudomonas sp. GW460-R15]
MNPKTAPITLAPQYRRALRTYRPVVLYFAHPHCYACEFAGPIFRATAEAYKDRAEFYMLNTAESPRHPKVSGTPTVLCYCNGKLLRKLKGFDSAETLNNVFIALLGKARAKPVPRRPQRDLQWLRQPLGSLRTVPRAHQLLAHRSAKTSKPSSPVSADGCTNQN